jgi:hypothetical protein
MAPGNFSNGGVDTFDARRHYVGVRLQQGVPLLDRDWNELEDIRRYFERRTRELNIGGGVPDTTGFAIRAANPPAADVLIAAGSCSTGGLDAQNDAEVLFSKQGDLKVLPPVGAVADTLVVYLEAWVARVDETTEGNLLNKQDINIVTCLRDQLKWAVRVVVAPKTAPAGSHVLAEINRQPNQAVVTGDMIVDRRRTKLNLADALDRLGAAERRLGALEKGLADLTTEVRGIPSTFDHARFDRPYVFA